MVGTHLILSGRKFQSESFSKLNSFVTIRYLGKNIHGVKHIAQSALSLAEQNQNGFIKVCTELRNTKKELAEIRTELKEYKKLMIYCKFNCDELKLEHKTLKEHSNKLDNYSKRKKLIIKEEKKKKAKQMFNVKRKYVIS